MNLTTLYAVVPHLPGYPNGTATYRHAGGGGTHSFPSPAERHDQEHPQRVIPRMDVLNMLHHVADMVPNRLWVRVDDDPKVIANPPTFDLVVGWNPDEAAHIETVTGWHLSTGTIPAQIVWASKGDDHHQFPVGVVAARFHVTGCHRAVTDNFGHGTYPCCQSPWAITDEPGLWHWTGHAEKVQP